MRGLVVLIAGPTASGKSALAVALAKRLQGVVINADSMQVYSDLHLLTARPDVADLAIAPHHLYGHVDADTDYSVGRWVDDAKATLADAWRAQQIPILVGGTGLYFRALTHGLVEIPAIPEAARAHIRTWAETKSNSDLHAQLSARDPDIATRLNPNDRQRILRALEVEHATGRPLSHWQQDVQTPFLTPAQTVRMVLEVERDELCQRIDARFLNMLEAGALDEVKRLAARNLPATRTALKAHGAPALTRHLAGQVSLDDAIAEGQGDTRRYAKRQVTFFRHQMPDWQRSAPQSALDKLIAAIHAQSTP